MSENENVSNERLERITRVYRPLYYALRHLKHRQREDEYVDQLTESLKQYADLFALARAKLDLSSERIEELEEAKRLAERSIARLQEKLEEQIRLTQRAERNSQYWKRKAIE